MIYHEWPDMLQYMDKNVKIYQISCNIMLLRNGLLNLSMYLIPRSDLVNLSINIILRNGLAKPLESSFQIIDRCF